MNDITVEHGTQIQIKNDGSIIWINIDGICRLRINNIKLKDIEIEDNRNLEDWKQDTNKLDFKWEKVNPERKENG